MSSRLNGTLVIFFIFYIKVTDYLILTQCKDTNDIENTQIYFHEIYENTQIWMFESFITIITIVASHQSGIYGLSQKSIKLLHNRKNSSKRSEFFRFYLYFAMSFRVLFVIYFTTLR